MGKHKISAIAAYVVIGAVFLILTLIIPFEKTAASWLMLVFSLVSVGAGATITVYAFDRKELKSKYYGFPVFRMGALYTGFQLLAAAVIYIIGAFTYTAPWISVAISVVLAGFAVLGLIASDSTRNYIEESEHIEIGKTRQIETFQTDISDILDICQDREAREAIKKLADRLKYSDPVSSEATRKTEDEIAVQLKKLAKLIIDNKPLDIIAKAEEISCLLSSRNRLCEKKK